METTAAEKPVPVDAATARGDKKLLSEADKGAWLRAARKAFPNERFPDLP
jgi:hypothetical protein